MITALADARARLRETHLAIDEAAANVAQAQQAAERARQITAQAEDALAGAEHVLANAEDRAAADLARFISKSGNKKPPVAATCEEEARRVDAARRQVKICKAAQAPVNQALREAGERLAELRQTGEAIALEIIEAEAGQLLSRFEHLAGEHRAALSAVLSAPRWAAEVARTNRDDPKAQPMFRLAERLNDAIGNVLRAGDPTDQDIDAAAVRWGHFANELGRDPEAALR